jgi:hypothetical protein
MCMLLFVSAPLTNPGGTAVFWSVGYYPAGTRGVGPPGAMFVMSTEDWWGGTWYRFGDEADIAQTIRMDHMTSVNILKCHIICVFATTENPIIPRRYMLNQLTLDRGPAVAYPAGQCANGVNDNCWGAGNAGGMYECQHPHHNRIICFAKK